MSKCGFPAFDVAGANIDITVLKSENKAETDDVGDSEVVSSDQVAVVRQKDGKIAYNAGTGQNDITCGKMRKLYVTVTNIPPTPEAGTRILQAAQNLQLTFSASAGTASSAKNLILGAVFAVMTIMSVLF